MKEMLERPFWEKKNESFAPYTDAYDLLQTKQNKPELGASVTETQYFGFNIPEKNIHGLCLMWHHPNLRTVTGGAYVWQGVKEDNFECELFDFVTYMSDDCLRNDLWDYTLDNSYRVQTLELLKRHRISYLDPTRQNAFDIYYDAIMPPMVLGTGLHLEQAARTSGQVTLRGTTFKVDGYTVRDRSWGQKRPEFHTNFPPMAWMTGVRDERFIFSCTAWDTPATSPDFYPGLEIPGGQNIKGGWVYKDGELHAVLAARKTTYRNRRTLYPESVDLEFVDAQGQVYLLKGTITAAAGWRTWHNFRTVICLARWEYEGEVFYGDFQECHWADFVRLARADRNS